MIGCKYSEFLESLYSGHEFEIEFNNKKYSIQRGDNSISVYDTTLDTVPFPLIIVLTGENYHHACDKFLASTIFDNHSINNIEKDVHVLNED